MTTNGIHAVRVLNGVPDSPLVLIFSFFVIDSVAPFQTSAPACLFFFSVMVKRLTSRLHMQTHVRKSCGTPA